MLVPRLRVRMPAARPLVSVVIPARNEEQAIERTVRAFLAQTYPNLEIIAVDDRSTDATGAILDRIADPRLVVIHGGEDPPPGWLGKPWALHRGSLAARGELLLFVDADVFYAPEAVAAAVAQLEESDVPMLALFPRLEMHGFWEHIAMPNLSVMAFQIMPLTLSNRTASPALPIGAGTGNLVRRADYDAAGGHEALKDAVVDDVGLSRLLRRSGRRTVAVRADEFISVRMYRGLSEIVGGFTKNCFTTFGRNYLLALALVPFTLVFQVLPFVLAFTGDALFVAAAATITLSRVVLFASLGYRLDNAVLGTVPMALLWLYILLRSMWYTGIRRQLHWRGRTYDAGRTRFGAD
jgi:chlorobactene glucosyltransferase